MATQEIKSQEEFERDSSSAPEEHHLDPDWLMEIQPIITGEEVVLNNKSGKSFTKCSDFDGYSYALESRDSSIFGINQSEFQAAVSGEEVTFSKNYQQPTAAQELQDAISKEELTITPIYKYQQPTAAQELQDAISKEEVMTPPRAVPTTRRKIVRAVRNHHPSSDPNPKPKNDNPWLDIIEQIENKSKNENTLPMTAAVSITKKTYPGIREDHPEFPLLVAETLENYFAVQKMMMKQNQDSDQE